jgi:hypothetical protein
MVQILSRHVIKRGIFSTIVVTLENETVVGSGTVYMLLPQHMFYRYSETSIHHFRRGSEKETMDPGKQ